MPDILPRVYLHDGSLVRIGQIVTAAALDRSYLLGEEGVCTFSMSPDDPLFAEAQPTLGRVLVVESPLYPLLWVGKLSQARRGAERGALTLTARSYDRILSERVLGAEAGYQRECGAAMAQVIEDVNGTNPTGIGIGRIAGPRAIFDGRLPYETARSAIDKIAEFGGMEWWLTYSLGTSNELTIRFNATAARGVDAYQRCALVDGGNARWDDWIEDAEALTFGLTVVGGQATAGQAFNARPAAALDVQAAGLEPEAPHGYVLEGTEPNLTPLTRSDRLVVAEHLRSTGLAAEAARAQLGRQRLAGAVRSLRLTVTPTDATVWRSLEPGNVVRVVAPTAFWTGWDGPARIVGAQPDEQGTGGCALVLRLARPRHV